VIGVVADRRVLLLIAVVPVQVSKCIFGDVDPLPRLQPLAPSEKGRFD